ncbi:hybrid sensor histidine kinase/response regulator [Bradyrhizobium macuxiense]|uniref:histidine kinase n=1 Tax=Bradyrhizobium macuxiense TaxID=1755647 RepID=A0A109JHC0_9BRAD|nr:ATP-binding protein [Bradyrhizobium macuxiense]KWV48941.1 hybrid sensor histidine kinase/response regulator [Bradyrhizobium macuxiense]
MTDTRTSHIATLEREAEKLRKINAALMSRVERSTDQQLNAFSLFETAIALDQQVRDRTQQLKQVLQSLEKTNGRLLQAKQQAEAASSLKSSVLVSVTHDLLQPLNAARLTLSALTEMVSEPKGVVLTDQIDRSLATLEDMLRTLLDISKLDAGVLKPEFGPVAIASLFEPLQQEFSPTATKRNLSLRIMPSSGVVRSDPLMLRRILQNLLANALRYTQRGSVLMGCRTRGDNISIEVHDTGPGIPEAQREAIFVEFQRGDASAGDKAGIGLGLSIVRRFANVLGHDIRLTSRPGQGSIFSVTLPRTADPVAIPAREQASVDYRYGGMEGAKILLIENDLSSAEGLASLLEKWGCDVAVTISKTEALERIRALDGVPDAIIADLHLDNGETGIEAVDVIRNEIKTGVPAIIVTADHSAKAASDVSAFGHELLKKPIKPAEMRSLLSFLLAAEQPATRL